MDTDTNIETTSNFILDLDIKSINVIDLSFRALGYLEKIKPELSPENTGHLNQLISRIWADEAKEVAILLRNSLLNILKLEYMHMDGLKNEEEVEAYKLKIISTINNASKELNESFQLKIKGTGENYPAWIHETNPAPFICKQLNTIEEQIKRIQRSNIKLSMAQKAMKDYRKGYSHFIRIRRERYSVIYKCCQTLLDYLELMPVNVDKPAINKLIVEADNLVEEISNIQPLPEYNSITLENVDKLTLVVNYDNGRLVFKTIDILSEVSSWVTYKLARPLRAADDDINAFKDKASIAIFRLSNRLKAKADALGDKSVEIYGENLGKSLSNIVNQYKELFDQDITKSFQEVEELLKRNLIISQLFNNKYNFLPISKLDQLSGNLSYKNVLHKRYNFDLLKESWNQLLNNYFRQEKDSGTISATSYIDKLLQFTQDSNKNALFLRKGFLGSTFSVERKIKLSKIDDHLNLWLEGYGGSLLISGEPGSGVSTLLEMLTARHTTIQNYNVIPSQTLEVKGVTLFQNLDLIQNLKDIIIHQGQEKCIITVDNIEQYVSSADDAFSLFSSLLTLIRKYNNQHYFAIAINDSLKIRLENCFDLSSVFSEVIDAKGMTSKMIQEALIMRINAVTEPDDLAVNQDKLYSEAMEIAQFSNGNIGLAMQLSCMTIDRKFMTYQSKQFNELIKKHRMIMECVLMYDHFNIQNFHDVFDETMSCKSLQSIDHLVNQKILQRSGPETININPILRYIISNTLNN